MLVMVTLGITSVQAATEIAGDAYYNYYVSTSNFVDETVVEEEGVDYIENGFDRGFIVIKEPYHFINPLDLTGYNWTVKASGIQTSYVFRVNAGQSISVSCICSPSSATFKMGIVQPNGTLRYVLSSSGTAAHTFSIDYDGEYAIYVKNMSDGSITVMGSYNAE